MVEIPEGVWTRPLEIEHKYQENKNLDTKKTGDMALHGMQLLIIRFIVYLVGIESLHLSYMNHCKALQIP